uniref:Uncharacterized protein n=1 Tax=Pinguiococcus pyrenoidosus TaxID=172671 RepID=A0A7R9UFG3_9STRA|mmetsp:Transcript_6272/g.24446  ORF Transcript_6272/g.24446 Transcript_6272/m.24446 type:complete len:250 (+) Transcript_6272:141-890(+)
MASTPQTALFLSLVLAVFLPCGSSFRALPSRAVYRSSSLRSSPPNQPETEPGELNKPPRGPHTEGFIVGGPSEDVTLEELSNENLLRIIRQESTDRDVNMLVWRCLGYRGVETSDGVEWTGDKVFPKWKVNFPLPPDVIGESRTYMPQIDKPVMEANRALVRTIPMAHKQSLKKYLRPAGFPGFKLKELTPNKTRRAQAVNWLLFFREELYGKTVDELIAKRERERQEEANAAADGEPPGFTPPIREVF